MQHLIKYDVFSDVFLMQMSLCGHYVTAVYGGKVFLEEHGFKKHQTSAAVRLEPSQLFCSWMTIRKVLFIHVNTISINLNSQKREGIVLELHSSKNIIHVHFLWRKLPIISHQTIRYRPYCALQSVNTSNKYCNASRCHRIYFGTNPSKTEIRDLNYMHALTQNGNAW